MFNALLWIVQFFSTFLRTIDDHEDCPDGLCAPVLAKAEELKAELTVKGPTASFGVFDIVRLLRCVPIDRVVAVAKRAMALLQDCDQCPDGECSFFDLLKCLDLSEVVSVVEEALDILRESRFCIDGDRGEITLGQVGA